MAENKTQKNRARVSEFVASVENEKRRADCKTVMKMMRDITGKRAAMWGSSIIGFGQYHYKYDSGREGDMCMVGLSPRKQNLVLYVMQGFNQSSSLMKRLGKHRTGKSCLYINKLDDVDPGVLREIIEQTVKYMRATYDCS